MFIYVSSYAPRCLIIDQPGVSENMVKNQIVNFAIPPEKAIQAKRKKKKEGF